MQNSLLLQSQMVLSAELSANPHQFFFQAFGEDYHALIRRFDLGHDVRKIDAAEKSQSTRSRQSQVRTLLESSQPHGIPWTLPTTFSSFHEPLASPLYRTRLCESLPPNPHAPERPSEIVSGTPCPLAT